MTKMQKLVRKIKEEAASSNPPPAWIAEKIRKQYGTIVSVDTVEKAL